MSIVTLGFKLSTKNKILDKALKLALANQAGTYEYAIAFSMGYYLEDDGSYRK